MFGDNGEPPARRREPLTWPVVAALAIVVVCFLGAGALLLMCFGRWP